MLYGGRTCLRRRETGPGAPRQAVWCVWRPKTHPPRTPGCAPKPRVDERVDDSKRQTSIASPRQEGTSATINNEKLQPRPDEERVDVRAKQ